MSQTTYPKELLPVPTQKKFRKHKASYCQRLARRLDRFDENPAVWKPELTLPLPPILRIPRELRQGILFFALDEDEMSIPRPNFTTGQLSLVCKEFAADIPGVNTMWDVRAGQLSKLFGYEQNAMSALIKDMMGPIQVASATLSNQKALRTRNSRKKARR